MPDRIGRPTDTRFSEEELMQRELSMSNMQYKLQYQIDATLSDIERYPLRCADVMVTDIDRYLPEVVLYEKSRHLTIEDLPCCGMAFTIPVFIALLELEGSIAVDEVPTVMALDPAAGGADEFAWCVVKAWAGNYFLVDSGGRLGGVSDSLLEADRNDRKEAPCQRDTRGDNFGGLEVYSQVLKPYLVAVGAECRIEPLRSKRKEVRIIDTLAPVLQTHRFIVDRKVVEKDAEIVRNAKDDRDVGYSLFYQLTRLTHDRGCLIHDDRLDALAFAVQWFQEQAAADQELRMSGRRQEYLESMFADWTGHVLMTIDRIGWA